MEIIRVNYTGLFSQTGNNRPSAAK